MHYVYILYSQSIDRYYIGESEFPEGRLDQHNSGLYKGAFTKQVQDWKIYLLIALNNRNEALLAERYIKSRKSRKYIESLKLYPEKVDVLKEKVK